MGQRTNNVALIGSARGIGDGKDGSRKEVNLDSRTLRAIQVRLACALIFWLAQSSFAGPLQKGSQTFHVTETSTEIKISSPQLEAVVQKEGYVSGVFGGTFLDKKTGFRDVGFGLDVVDWLMEPGSDESDRSQLHPDLVYEFNNLVHGNIPKKSIEGGQICTMAKRVAPRLTRGLDFLAVITSFKFWLAAPGKEIGSNWTQKIVFPTGKRYFISSDTITTVNSSEAMFLRVDMPGHVKHSRGDRFSEIYLSYFGTIPAKEFFDDFPPDRKFIYRRSPGISPQRMIRAYRLRDPVTGRLGPWLGGMTLNAAVVSEAWCHQRGYVCMIQEFGGKPVKPGDSFSAAFVVGYFDSIDEMNRVYDQYAGYDGLEVSGTGWQLTRSPR